MSIDREGNVQVVAPTFLVKAAGRKLFTLLFGHPRALPVGAVLGHEPLLGRGAMERAGRKAPAVLHDNFAMDPLHQVVYEDGPSQVHFRVINKLQLF